jgi:hypothetical protein
MPETNDLPSLLAPGDHPDLRELAWLDELLRQTLSDVLKRGRLARSTGQHTLQLVLEAQAASLTRLRATIHTRYWSRLNGANEPGATLSNRC